ncbi:MAG: prepilin-type N-terminal cleavage/methylation domain-containing protein [Rudaea sp.]
MALPRPQRGFTLLEVLLAIILLALLIAGAYSGIRASANAMHAGERAIDRADRLRTAQGFLRRQISHIIPLSYEHDDQTNTVHVFDGGAQFMRFVAPMPGYLSRGGPYVQTLELVRGKDGLQLRFTDAMLNGYEAQNPKIDEPVVILDRIRAGQFQYRTLDEQGQLTDWFSDWPDPSVTPLMVRVSLDMQPGVQIPWPELDVPLMLNAGAVRPNNGFVPNLPSSALRGGRRR